MQSRRGILRDLLLFVAIGAGLWMAQWLTRLIAVLLVAVCFAYVLAPLVDFVQRSRVWPWRRHGMPRAAAIAFVYLFLTAGAAGGLALLWPSASRQLDEALVKAPAYTESFRTWQRGWTRYYAQLPIPREARRTIDRTVVGVGEAALGYAHGSVLTAIGVLAAVPWLALVPILAFLLLKDAAAIRTTLITALPYRVQARNRRLLDELNRTLAAYAHAQVVACVIVGSVCGAGFALLGMPYAILLGVFAAVFEFIPLVGPLVVAIVAIGVAAMHSSMLALATAVFLAVLRIIQDYAIYPRLMSRDVHLHPLVVILAVLAGAELGGVAGIFTAIPIVALLTVAARHYLAWRAQDASALASLPTPPARIAASGR